MTWVPPGATNPAHNDPGLLAQPAEQSSSTRVVAFLERRDWAELGAVHWQVPAPGNRGRTSQNVFSASDLPIVGPPDVLRYTGPVKVRMEVSVGELIDRVTILRIKLVRLPEEVRGEIRRELRAAESMLGGDLGARAHDVADLAERLHNVNLELWEVEEELRACERRGQFGARFVELARRVYLTNDQRAALKRRIDLRVGSSVREHKSYALPEV